MKKRVGRIPLCLLTIAIILSACSWNTPTSVPASPSASPTTFDPITLTPTWTVQPTSTRQPTPYHDYANPSATPTLLPPNPTSTFSLASETSLKDECIRITSGMKELQAQEGFNPQLYFQVLTHLRTKSGYRLDYFLFGDDLGGLPLVYSRKTTDRRLENYDEFLSQFGEQKTTERSYSGLNHADEYLKIVQTDGSDESYFEYVTLAMLGGQFRLYWHGLYNDYKIMCQTSDVEDIRADLQDLFEEDLPENIISRAKEIDYTPIVKRDGDKVILRYVSFTKWGGLFEEIYTIDANDPYHIIDYSYVPLIDYDCGVAF
jgi:hypothetical protein